MFSRVLACDLQQGCLHVEDISLLDGFSAESVQLLEVFFEIQTPHGKYSIQTS